MKEQKKKQLIVVMLLVACFISGYMLFNSSTGEPLRLTGITQADSLIHKELTHFNINEQQIRTSSVKIDSNFNRRTYHIGVPQGFSKTQLHAELNRIFYQYAIDTPAKVDFTENKIKIHLLYSDTIIRTISLETDPDLVHAQKRMSILISFPYLPKEEYINKLISLGEPIPLALKIENPMQAKELKKQLGDRYRHLIFWLQSANGEDLLKTNSTAALAKLNRLQKLLPQASMLTFGNLDIDGSKDWQKLFSHSDLSFIIAENALLLSEEMGKASFFEGLDKLKNDPTFSTSIINGNGTTLSWLTEKLPELKKAGVELVPPPQSHF